MIKTNYTIIKEATYIVMEGGSHVTKGFTDIDSALHSIWVLNGKVKEHFYQEVNGFVYLEQVKCV